MLTGLVFNKCKKKHSVKFFLPRTCVLYYFWRKGILRIQRFLQSKITLLFEKNNQKEKRMFFGIL